MFPDLTVYNRKEQLATYMQTAQYGFPATLVACALGLNTNELVGMSLIENEFLNLNEILQPLQSSHTQSANDQSNDKEDRGRKEVSDSEISDKGQTTRDSGSNAERDAKS